MRTILEIFYVRIMGSKVCYQRKQANLSKRGSSPDKLIQSLIQEKRNDSSGDVEEKEFIVHSTSWRYTKPDKVMLTYVAYSDDLEFQKGKTKRLPLKKLKTMTKKSYKPRSQTELQNRVVSHALRHVAFLIQTERQSDFTSTPETKKVFEKLWVSLAGKVF